MKLMLSQLNKLAAVILIFAIPVMAGAAPTASEIDAEYVSKATKASLLAQLPKMTRLPVLPDTHPFMIRASSAADDIDAALAADDVPVASRPLWKRRLWTWGYYESAFITDAVGDKGASLGVMQIQTPEKWLAGATREKVLKDRVLGFRAGMALMKILIDKCGSTRAGLTAYATDGACHNWKLPIVTYRCHLAKDDC